MRKFAVWALAWAGCTPPTMLGAFTDGVGPARGTTDVTVVGAGAASSALGPGVGGGVWLQPALGERTSLGLGGGAYAAFTEDRMVGLPYWAFQVRRRLERDLDGRTHWMWMTGTGGQVYPAGLHTALIGARDVGSWRIYGGGGVQVTLLFSTGAYGLGTAGLTWNPPERRHSFGMEASLVVGSDAESGANAVGVASVYLRTRVGKEKQGGKGR